jgi:hypothetical protein
MREKEERERERKRERERERGGGKRDIRNGEEARPHHRNKGYIHRTDNETTSFFFTNIP